ncbi:hypothetical protein AAVH_27620 [Aphelenchoides avenae]|nr:hypothetical protein AAVH_27620 [Aphelenchus avenae]
MSWDIYEQMLKFNLQLRGELSEELKKATIITEIGIEVYSELINSLEGKEYNLMGRRAIKGFGIDLNEKLYGESRVVIRRGRSSDESFSSLRESSKAFSYPRGGFLPTAGEKQKRGFSTISSDESSSNESNDDPVISASSETSASNDIDLRSQATTVPPNRPSYAAIVAGAVNAAEGRHR